MQTINRRQGKKEGGKEGERKRERERELPHIYSKNGGTHGRGCPSLSKIKKRNSHLIAGSPDPNMRMSLRQQELVS